MQTGPSVPRPGSGTQGSVSDDKGGMGARQAVYTSTSRSFLTYIIGNMTLDASPFFFRRAERDRSLAEA